MKMFAILLCLPKELKHQSLVSKSVKASFVIYAHLEWLKEKTDRCKYYLENSTAAKAGKHILSIFSMATKLSFKSMENKYDVYRCKYCMEKFCKSLIEHAIWMINFKKRKSF